MHYTHLSTSGLIVECILHPPLLLLRRAPRALESGPSERQHLLGVGREDSEWGRRTFRRPSRFGHLCSQCSSVCGSSLHSGHVGSAARRSVRTPWPFRGLLSEGSVTVRRMRLLRWRMRWVEEAYRCLVCLVTWNPDKGGGAFPVV